MLEARHCLYQVKAGIPTGTGSHQLLDVPSPILRRQTLCPPSHLHQLSSALLTAHPMLPPFFLLACGWFLLAKGKVFFCQEPWKYWHREQVKFQLNQQGFRSECRIHHCLRIACWVPALKGNFKYLIANHPGVRHALQVDHVVIVGTAKANNFSLKKTEISVFQTSMLTL